jgi:hypothetical protein
MTCLSTQVGIPWTYRYASWFFQLGKTGRILSRHDKTTPNGVDNEVAHEAISFYSVAWKIRRRRRRSWSPQSAKLTFTVDWQGFADLGNAASTARTARCDKRGRRCRIKGPLRPCHEIHQVLVSLEVETDIYRGPRQLLRPWLYVIIALGGYTL